MEQQLRDMHRLACRATGSIVLMLVSRKVRQVSMRLAVQNLREALKMAEELLRSIEERG